MLSAGGCAIINNKPNEGGGLMRLKIKWKVFLLALAGTAVLNGLRALVDYQILSRYCQGNVLILHIVFSICFPMYEAAVFFYYRNKPCRDFQCSDM